MLTMVSSVSLLPSTRSMYSLRTIDNHEESLRIVAALLPGDTLVGDTVSLGLLNAISLYSNIIFARYLSKLLK